MICRCVEGKAFTVRALIPHTAFTKMDLQRSPPSLCFYITSDFFGDSFVTIVIILKNMCLCMKIISDSLHLGHKWICSTDLKTGYSWFLLLLLFLKRKKYIAWHLMDDY